jgi:hypothetical protein
MFSRTVGIHKIMEFKITNKSNSGIFYMDKEITCLKDENNSLNVYKNNLDFDLLFSIQWGEIPGVIGKTKEGIFNFENKNTTFYDLEGKSTSTLENTFIHVIKDSYTAFRNVDSPRKLYFKGVVNAEIEGIRPAGKKIFLEEKFIHVTDRRNSEITCNNLQLNGEVSWKIDLKEITDSHKAFIHSKIIVYGSSLYVVCDGQENRSLFEFDIETGDLKNSLDKFYEIYQEEHFIYTSKFPNILCRIDCRNNSIEEWNTDDLLKENNFDSIHDHRCDVRNEKYYFTQSLGDNKAKFGILDFQNKKLTYKHDFVPENGAIGSIRTSDLRTFIHTQDGQLHIFE